MALFRRLALGSIVAAALAALVTGCSDDAEEGGSSSGGPGSVEGRPPKADPNGVAGDGPGAVFAMERLFLGDTDRAGKRSDTAWKSLGFNVDGQVSTESSTALCKPQAGAKPSNVYPDGEHGTDNAFGRSVVPLLSIATASPSADITEAITAGDFTVLFRIDGLGDKPDYNGLTSRLYSGGTLGHAPTFDGTDAWPVLRELLLDPADIDSSKVVFKDSYVTDDTWVSGTDGVMDVTLTIQGTPLKLHIQSATVAMTLDADRGGAKRGVVAGVLETETFLTELEGVIGAMSTSLCDGPLVEGIYKRIRQASDIMKDGSPGSPSAECDGISIGLGFDAAAVQLGPVAPPATPPTDPCAN